MCMYVVHWNIFMVNKHDSQQEQQKMFDNLVSAICKNPMYQHDKITKPFRKIAPT